MENYQFSAFTNSATLPCRERQDSNLQIEVTLISLSVFIFLFQTLQIYNIILNNKDICNFFQRTFSRLIDQLNFSLVVEEFFSLSVIYLTRQIYYFFFILLTFQQKIFNPTNNWCISL